MFSFFYPLIRSVLFRIDPEKTHDLTLKWLKRIEASPFRFIIHQQLVEDPVEVFGIRFPNRLGLAAGLDKNGECIDAFAAMGFGHIEVGTVTPRAQPGNPSPRLFRLPKAKGIINRFGFNNQGVDKLIENIKASRFKGILGINIGKNFDTPVENAVDDYLHCMRKVYPFASYITVNISSPNTANLRQLQFGQALDDLLSAIKKEQAELARQFNKQVPVLIKIAPDLSESDLDELAKTFLQHKVDGVIATNTTFARDKVSGLAHAEEQGGLSGAPLLTQSNKILRELCEKTHHSFPVIGVGGVDSVASAKEKINCGADLVQIYSGFIYEGPGLVNRIVRGLAK